MQAYPVEIIAKMQKKSKKLSKINWWLIGLTPVVFITSLIVTAALPKDTALNWMMGSTMTFIYAGILVAITQMVYARYDELKESEYQRVKNLLDNLSAYDGMQAEVVELRKEIKEIYNQQNKMLISKNLTEVYFVVENKKKGKKITTPEKVKFLKESIFE